MTYEEIKAAWNAHADEFNQWCELGEDEKVEWAARVAVIKERAARQAAQAEVADLKGRIARSGVEHRRARAAPPTDEEISALWMRHIQYNTTGTQWRRTLVVDILAHWGAQPTPPDVVEPLTDETLDAMRQADNGQLNFVTLRQFRVIARAVERAHGIHPDTP